MQAAVIPGIEFAWPAALLALLVLPALLALTWRAARRRAAADAVYGGSDDLRVGRSTLLRVLRATLFALALVLLIVGIARPRWGLAEAPIEQRGIDVVFAIDVSRSMEADDVAPSRAVGVATAIEETLAHLHGNRVGLVIFGDTAFERAPLTLDIDAIGALVQRARSESALVEPGTSLAAGIHAALDVLDVAEPAHAQAIVIASDGEDLSGVPVDLALDRASARGVPVHAIFAGSDVPVALPEFRGMEDVTTADRSSLELIASATGAQVREPGNAAGLAVEFRRMRQTAFEADTDAVRAERFTWFVGAALAVLVLQALVPEAARRRARPRRGAVAAGAAGMLLVAACSGTAVWQQVDRGNEAYAEARYEDALDAYRAAAELDEEGEHAAAVQHNVGNALHQLGRYADATDATRAALEAADDAELAARLRYALGNHLVRDEDLIAAHDAYVAVLRFDPGHMDAKANLELVLEALSPDEIPDLELPDDLDPPPPPDDDLPGDQPGNGDGDRPGQDGDPGDGDPTNGDAQDGDENGLPVDGPLTPSPGDPSGDGTTVEDVLDEIEALLGELGDELTPDEAARLLELHRLLNELRPLPAEVTADGVPPR